jgi:hypothetical protein
MGESQKRHAEAVCGTNHERSSSSKSRILIGQCSVSQAAYQFSVSLLVAAYRGVESEVACCGANGNGLEIVDRLVKVPVSVSHVVCARRSQMWGKAEYSVKPFLIRTAGHPPRNVSSSGTTA